MLPLASSIENTHRVLPRACTRAWMVGCLLLLFPAAANALSFSLDIEFDNGSSGEYASIEITENGDDALDFVITANSDLLGSGADLHVLYFNIDDSVVDPDGLGIELTNAPTTEYRLIAGPAVRGGASSSFDFGIDFGNGAGSPGNGVLQIASFTLTGLTLEALSESSFTSGGSIEINFAAHIQGTSLYAGANSETVGGRIPAPEPATGTLPLLGLLGFAARRRRRSR